MASEGELKPVESFTSDTKDIAKGAMTNFIGIVTRSLGLIFLVVVARLYGTHITGLFLLSRVSIDMISKLGILGFDRAILSVCAMKTAERNEAGLYRTLGQAFLIGLAASTGLALLLQTSAGSLADRFFQEPELRPSLQMMAWGIPFLFLSAFCVHATRSLRVMRYEVYTKSLVEPLFLLLLAVSFYRIEPGMKGLSIAFVVSTVFGAIAAGIFFSRLFSWKKLIFHLSLKGDGAHLLRLAVPAGFVDLSNLLIQRIDVILIGRFLPVSAVGVYGLAQEAAFAIKKVRQAFDPIFIPVISGASQVKDRSSMLLQYRNVTRWILLVDLCLLGVVALAASSILQLFGADFVAGAVPLIILALGVVVSGVLGVSELFLLIGRPMVNLGNTVLSLFLTAGLLFYSIPRFGMVGAAVSLLIASLIVNGIRLAQVASFCRLQPWTSLHSKASLIFFLSLALPFSLKSLFGVSHPFWEAVFAVIFLGIYLTSLISFGLVDEEKRIIEKGISGLVKRWRLSRWSESF